MCVYGGRGCVSMMGGDVCRWREGMCVHDGRGCVSVMGGDVCL